MERLFNTKKTDLERALAEIDEDAIQGFTFSEIYYRGLEYFERGHVTEARFSTDKTLLSANVYGSKKYSVQLKLEKGTIYAKCNCPFDDVCKHVVALLLYAVNTKIEVAPDRNENVMKYLRDLSKDELAELVLKYAPEDFWAGVNNRFSGPSDAEKSLRKAQQKIEKIFSDSDQLYDPHEFEALLDKMLGTLSGLEYRLPMQATKLIFFIVEKVEEAFDNGYLYDHYGDYNFEPPESFFVFVTNCAKAMDFADRVDFIGQLDDEISQANNSTFDSLYSWFGGSFEENEWLPLKTVLMQSSESISLNLVGCYYDLVEPILSAGEKEHILILLMHHNKTYIVDLAKLLETTGKQKRSILMLKKFLGENQTWSVSKEVCFIYLDQLKKENLDLDKPAVQCLRACPTEEVLAKIAEILPSSSAKFEKILEEKHPASLLDYLEKNQRLPEALALVKRGRSIYEDRKLTFYKRNKKTFPAEASRYFTDVVNEHLKEAGNYHYQVIIDALKQLKVLDSENVRLLILDIRRNYKRRGNLMLMLDEI